MGNLFTYDRIQLCTRDRSMGKDIQLYFQHEICLSLQDHGKGFRTSQIDPYRNKPQNLQVKQEQDCIQRISPGSVRGGRCLLFLNDAMF